MRAMALRRCNGYVGASYRQAPHDVPNDPEHFYSHKTICRTCYLAYAADWRANRRAKGITTIARAVGGVAAKTVLDGVEQLTEVLRLAGYSVVEAVAKYTIFLDPATVAQTNGQALFPIIRNMDMGRRGTFEAGADGRTVMLDDNTSPTDAFLWSGQLRKGRDVQFNHVWNDSRNRHAYTALWNLCATPAFLAKTTDGSNHPEVVAALRYRAYSLYGMRPDDEPVPQEPAGYSELRWAPHPDPVRDLESVLRTRLRANPKRNTTRACRQIGWLFSGWVPDDTV
jgi:hypothetical protein